MSKKISVNRDAFPFCCGIKVIGGFNGVGWEVVGDELQSVADALHLTTLKQALGCSKTENYVATTIISQSEVIKQLKKNGFEVIRKFRNPSTKHIVSL